MVTRVYGRLHNILPVQATHQADDEVLWNDFITDFTGAFAEQAYANLTKLEMKGDGIDEYIAVFEYLLIRARWERDARGSLEFIKQGLRKGLHWTILRHAPMLTTIDKWQAAARSEGQRRRMYLPAWDRTAAISLAPARIADEIPQDDHRVGSL